MKAGTLEGNAIDRHRGGTSYGVGRADAPPDFNAMGQD